MQIRRPKKKKAIKVYLNLHIILMKGITLKGIKLKLDQHKSSNINEVIRAVLSFLFFLEKDFTHTHTHTHTQIHNWQNIRCKDKIKSSLRTFRQYIYTNEKQEVKTLFSVSTFYILSGTSSKCEDSYIKLKSLHLNYAQKRK